MKKVKKISIIITIIISLVALYIYNYYNPLFRVYIDPPEFVEGTQWVSDSPAMNFMVNSQGALKGKIDYKDEKIDFEINFKAQSAHIWLRLPGEKHSQLYAVGEWNISRDKKLFTIKKIDILDESKFPEYIDPDIKKIIFEIKEDV